MSSKKKLIGIGFVVLFLVAAFISLRAGIFRRQEGRIASIEMPGSGSTPAVINSVPAGVYDRTGKLMSGKDLERWREYSVGHAIGSCLVQDCAAVLVGKISAIGEPQQEPGELGDWPVTYRKVDLTIEQWFAGDRKEPGQNVQLRHAEPTLTKSSGGPWKVWSGVQLKVGEKLLVALWGPDAQRLKWKDQPEPIALVIAADDALVAAVAECINLHARLAQSPDQIEQVPELLKVNPDGVLGGYIVSYLVGAELKRNADRAAIILSALLRLPALPDVARQEAAKEVSTSFYRLSADTRRKVVESLIVTASDRDLNQASPALSGLIRLADLKLLDLKTVLSPERRRKVIANYQAALAEEKIDKGQGALESQLGLKPSG